MTKPADSVKATGQTLSKVIPAVECTKSKCILTIHCLPTSLQPSGLCLVMDPLERDVRARLPRARVPRDNMSSASHHVTPGHPPSLVATWKCQTRRAYTLKLLPQTCTWVAQ